MPRFVAKYVHNIIIGPIIRFMKTILVIRESKESRLDTLNKLTTELSHDDASCIVIFPEGTCTNRMSLIEFRKGAFTPGIPVQPVIIRTNCVPWVYSIRFHYAIVPFFVFCNVINELEIEFLPLYKPDIEEKKFPLIYASNVRELMIRARERS
jgi:lysophosphatidylcholine acyltransferase/lyso-PAF acetyltransferase